MPAILYTAPAAAGKSAWVIDTVRRASAGFGSEPMVVVATPRQARALRLRLAAAGGALGVHIATFDELYAALLQYAGAIYVELRPPARYRVLRAAVDDLVAAGALTFYGAIVDRPGFYAAIEGLLFELKGANIRPQHFADAVAQTGASPRLTELAAIYTRYEELIAGNGWTDRAGLGWMAVDAVRRVELALPWAPVLIDGFDSFTVVQRELIAALADRIPAVTVLLTSPSGDPDAVVHRLFAETIRLLGQRLNVTPQPLPPAAPAARQPIRRLAEHLFVGAGDAQDGAADVALLAAADRAGEVRAALRWVKERIVIDGLRPSDLAVTARTLTPYRDLLVQTAGEFGLPLRIAGQTPLLQNPAIAALLDLLDLFRRDPLTGEPSLPRRPLVEAWRSPYFDWRAALDMQEGDAERLDAVARGYQVIRGLAQWQEALALNAAQAALAVPAPDEAELARPPAAEADALLRRVARFIDAMTPPAAVTMRDFVAWLEDLVGAEEADAFAPQRDDAPPAPAAVFSLDMLAAIRRGDPSLRARDVSALRAFKEVLRGLVLAEETTIVLRRAAPAADFDAFLRELRAALENASYDAGGTDADAILAAGLLDLRGLSVRAVAMLGLAEGEIPQRRREDPFLRDSDRERLRAAGLPLDASTRSFEREYFYTAVTRARETLLLTRPRLAEGGATWEPSPYWEEVRRLTGAAVVTVSAEARPPLAHTASPAEAMESAARSPEAAAWLAHHEPAHWARIQTGAAIVRAQRRGGAASATGDGVLAGNPDDLAALRQKLRRWSPSRLETYNACPHFFYVAYVLKLDARGEPEEGVDARQLGLVYHRLFETLYREAGLDADTPALLAALPGVAARILDEAPARDGFRVTALWQQQRLEIEDNVARSLVALAELGGTPIELEARVGDARPLTLTLDGEAYTLSGIVDRIDRLADGSLRIIDYKLGVSDYDSAKALVDGKRLQLPLYALAAGANLGHGEVSDGVYWFVTKARAGKWSLGAFTNPETGAVGAAAAIELAVAHAHAAVQGARQGRFQASPPASGCPEYCPAVGFCWQYRPKATA